MDEFSKTEDLHPHRLARTSLSVPAAPSPDPSASDASRTTSLGSTALLLSAPHGQLTQGQIPSNRYRLERLLGRGGMGEVYEAQDLDLGIPIALKTIRPEIASNPVALRRRAGPFRSCDFLSAARRGRGHPSAAEPGVDVLPEPLVKATLDGAEVVPQRQEVAGKWAWLTLPVPPGEHRLDVASALAADGAPCTGRAAIWLTGDEAVEPVVVTVTGRDAVPAARLRPWSGREARLLPRCVRIGEAILGQGGTRRAVSGTLLALASRTRLS